MTLSDTLTEAKRQMTDTFTTLERQVQAVEAVHARVSRLHPWRPSRLWWLVTVGLLAYGILLHSFHGQRHDLTESELAFVKSEVATWGSQRAKLEELVEGLREDLQRPTAPRPRRLLGLLYVR